GRCPSPAARPPPRGCAAGGRRPRCRRPPQGRGRHGRADVRGDPLPLPRRAVAAARGEPGRHGALHRQPHAGRRGAVLGRREARGHDRLRPAAGPRGPGRAAPLRPRRSRLAVPGVRRDAHLALRPAGRDVPGGPRGRRRRRGVPAQQPFADHRAQHRGVGGRLRLPDGRAPPDDRPHRRDRADPRLRPPGDRPPARHPGPPGRPPDRPEPYPSEPVDPDPDDPDDREPDPAGGPVPESL
ncbi:MAG: Transcriptional regulator, AcrR family, partial [uncultured Nocardioidaceae bacterium]